MSETQLVVALLPPLATLATVIVGFLYNNSRMSDLASGMTGRLNDMNSRMTDLRSDMKDLFRAQGDAHSANLHRVEDMLLGKFAELDTRLSRIEAHLNLR